MYACNSISTVCQPCYCRHCICCLRTELHCHITVNRFYSQRSRCLFFIFFFFFFPFQTQNIDVFPSANEKKSSRIEWTTFAVCFLYLWCRISWYSELKTDITSISSAFNEFFIFHKFVAQYFSRCCGICCISLPFNFAHSHSPSSRAACAVAWTHKSIF